MEKPTGLDLLRAQFPPHQISKLPKPTKKQTDDVKADYKKGIRCQLCGAWHHPEVVHLDYVGHAALTDRLLDADPKWTWEPLSTGPDGLPAFDKSGGLWIRLTVCGVTRLGYGNAANSEYKEVGSREKEVIGDALRNAAMRFGAALELWHKGNLHAGDEDEMKPRTTAQPVAPIGATVPSVPPMMEEPCFDEKPADPKTWIVQNGKYKGKRFLEIPRVQLAQWCAHWEKLGTTGSMKDDIMMARNYLDESI